MWGGARGWAGRAAATSVARCLKGKGAAGGSAVAVPLQTAALGDVATRSRSSRRDGGIQKRNGRFSPPHPAGGAGLTGPAVLCVMSVGLA